LTTTQPNWTKKTPSKVIGIQFSVLSPEEIRRCSVAEITSRDTYSNNVPVIGGMFDPRLGVLEPGLKCPTDGLDYIKTPGYFGHIELAKPVFYFQYLPTIMKILKCVCVKCSKLLINKESNKECMDMKPDDRWNHVHQLASKIKRCGDDTKDGCGCLVPKKIKKENLATLFAEWDGGDAEEGSGGGSGNKEKLNMKMTPEVVLKIFRRISDQDVAFMGFSPQFSRPDWFICQVLAIPPPAVRPSIKMDGNQRSEDDISHTIVNIIKANKTLLEKMNEPSVNSAIIDDWQSLLQYFIATQVDNNIPSCAPVAQRSGRPLKSIKERLNGKGGRVRGNLMGKRVDFSARSVITPDPNLSIRELGVPKKIAMNITKPVIVNNRNRDFLQQLVLNGPDVYPGANILEKKTGGDISLRYMDRSTVVLENGDVVHRHMMDGDGVLFNRQPTLHRMSMMCHIARIMQQGDTFRMNIGDTKPYNADFDGDEMNLHMPQDDEAEAELKGLAAVPYQIISPAKNNSIIGIFQDSLLGVYQFTRSGIGAFDARAAMNLLMGYKNVDVSLFSDPTKKITNFEILSQILPPLSMKYKTKQFGGSDDYATSNNVLEIRDGEILRGHIDSGVLASSTNGMIQRICNDFGNMASANFIDDLQNIITEYMKTSAYSVGISDLISDKKTTDKIIDSIKTKKLEVKTIIDNIHIGTFENKSGRTNEEEFELLVTNILNKANGEAGDIGLKSLSKTNRFITMVNAGSKGSKVNIAQMICLVGQQTIDGKRVPYGFDSRTLPHYSKYDDGPAARGFVENSFIAGLTPSEVFFHAMGGRVGLIDTAVKTSQTGYIQRRLIKGMEDIKVEYDMTVRNSKNRIVQFSYGEDGIDTVKIEHSSMNFIGMTPDEIYAHFYVPVGGDSETTSELKAVFSKTAFSRMKKQQKLCDEKSKKYTDYLMNIREDIVVKVFKNKNTTDAYLPLSFSHIVANIGGMQKINKNSEVDITPLETFILLEETYARFEQLQYAPPTELFKVMYYYSLTPRDLLMVKRFNRKAVVALAEMMVLMYKRAIVAPGEMVGMIAAQSIGEPTTQLTLNSVAYDTELLLRIDGAIRVVKIGEYIDNYIPKARKSEEHPNDTKLLYVNDDEEVYVPSVDEDGNTSWKRVEALTRHPVINLDGTNTVLRVTTKDGRSVIATKAKSFLTIDDNNKLVATNGSELKVGDYLPVNIRAFEMPESVRDFDLSTILKKSEYAFGSEMHKALSYSAGEERYWWSKHANIDFTVPYHRSDTFLEAMKTEPHIDKKTGNVASARQTFISGIVYPKKRFIGGGEIPEHIPLDFDFGYLIGAYCAEGCTTLTQISIANNCREFFAPIERLMEKWKITTKFYIHNNKNGEGWTSSDLRIYSIVLTNILNILCGKGSPNKCVNYLLFNSNKEFMRGLISAYFAGDGSVNKLSCLITAYSVSRTLLENIQSILCFWFGIYTKIKTNKLQLTNNIGSKNILQGYTLTMKCDGAKIFANEIPMLIPYKQERLNEYKLRPLEISSELKDIIPKYNHNKNMYYNVNRRKLVDIFKVDAPFKDIRFDKIVTIEEIPNPTEWAYDLTVEITRTFSVLNGLYEFDTFHLSGDASKSQVTRGLPRIEELLSLSENTKNPSTTIYLKPSDESNKDAAADLIPTIELTRLEDIVKSVEICFDPSDSPSETKIVADKLILAQYAEFQRMLKDVGGEDETECERERSKWILRMEMDRESMYEKRVTMDDVHFAIKAVYSKNDKSEVSCIYSDYNSDNLVFRIRLDFQKKDKEPKTLDQTDKIYQLKTFQDALMNNIILRGIKGIRNVLARKVVDMVAKENNTFRKKETWVLDTTGSNFMEILSLKTIDARRTISNDIQEINRVLGIEAARQALFNELYEAFDTTYINHHHISLLCDRMTSSSNLISIFRHGINNDDIGPIAKASFEETPEMFLKAARHAEVDHMRGISANVMCGQEGFYGTNAFKVMLDINQIMKMGQVATADKTVEEEKEAVIQGFMDKIAAEDPLNPCSKNKLTIQSTLDKIQGSNLGSVDPDYDMGF
jgi:DNA-directed RNA polymerase II subunit RPB1